MELSTFVEWIKTGKSRQTLLGITLGEKFIDSGKNSVLPFEIDNARNSYHSVSEYDDDLDCEYELTVGRYRFFVSEISFKIWSKDRDLIFAISQAAREHISSLWNLSTEIPDDLSDWPDDPDQLEELCATIGDISVGEILEAKKEAEYYSKMETFLNLKSVFGDEYLTLRAGEDRDNSLCYFFDLSIEKRSNDRP